MIDAWKASSKMMVMMMVTTTNNSAIGPCIMVVMVDPGTGREIYIPLWKIGIIYIWDAYTTSFTCNI